MQCQVHRRFFAGVVDEFIGSGRAEKFQAAADHPFVETFQPAQTLPAFEVDVFRVNQPLDRRIPAEA